jgi:hypothetical protein
MSCKHYEAQLIEAVASAAPLGPALQAHLAACQSCRTQYAGEQALSAAIDSELSLAVNVAPNTSFLPRVLAAVEDAAMHDESLADRTARIWLAFWPQVAAVTAICVVAALAATQLRSPGRDAPSPIVVVAAPSRAPQPPMLQADAVSGARMPIARTKTSPPAPVESAQIAGDRSASDAAFQAEILVPPDERDALARFSGNLYRPPDGAAASAGPVTAASRAPQTPAEPIDVQPQPLEIAELKVDPLRPAEEK